MRSFVSPKNKKNLEKFIAKGDDSTGETSFGNAKTEYKTEDTSESKGEDTSDEDPF
jgi:hypothetical protein